VPLARLLPLLFTLCLLPAVAATDAVTGSADSAETGEGAAEAPIADDEPGVLTEQLAEFTRNLTAEDVVRELTAALQALDPRSQAVDWSSVGAAVVGILLVILPTVAIFVVLRLLERPLFRFAGAWSDAAPAGRVISRCTIATVGAALSDFLVIVLAWVAGYACALFLLGEAGTMDPLQSIFLNAFLGLEAVKAAVRVVFAPRYYSLRLAKVGDEEAAYWNAWLARLVDFVGYGLLLVKPFVSSQIAPALGSLVGLIVLLLGLAYAIVIVRQNRQRVRSALEEAVNTSRVGCTRVVLALLARTWHLIVIAYFAAVAVVIQLRPDEALAILGQATLQSAVVVGAGLTAYMGLSRLVGRPLRVPAATRERLPDLEARLNTFVPAIVQVLRVALVIIGAFALLDAWHVFDLFGWLASDTGTRVLATFVSVLFIVVAASAVWVGLASWIDSRLQLDGEGGDDIGARKRTLLALFRNALAVALAIVTLMFVLSELGINIAPLLAGAGVVGLAIGFGAQKLVQDIITGVFIQLENAINTGDWITVSGLSGTVERLSIRSVGIRDLEGTFHIVPFSSVDTVSNYMREFAYHLGRYAIAYREDTDEAVEHLENAFAELMQDPDVASQVLHELEVDGVSGLGDSGVTIRIRIKTRAGMQWYVGRAYNRLVKRHFDAAGIEIPLPHTRLYFGQPKAGEPAPALVRLLEEDAAASSDGQSDEAPHEVSSATDGASKPDAGGLPPEFGEAERDAEGNPKPRGSDDDAPDDDTSRGS